MNQTSFFMKRLTPFVSALLCFALAWTCSGSEPEPVLESILIDQKAVILDIGEEFQLNAVLFPPEAHPTVFWESLNPTIAAVNKNGLVTGISAGSAKIKASASNLSATCEVWVNEADILMKWIRCRESELNMEVGDELHLYADYEPENSTEAVTWKSSNPSVASIKHGSILSAVAPGDAVVTATSSKSGLTASCKVTVKEKFTAVTSVRLDYHEYTMDAGSTLQLKASVKPDNATHQDVQWSSSVPKVATVDESGLVRALTEGDAVITATVDGKSDQCQLHVRIAPVSAEFKYPELTLRKSEERQLELILLPAGAKERSIQWKSSDPYTVHVNTNGLATGIKAGQATVSAQVDELPWITCSITVVEEVASIILDKTELSMSRGSTYRLTATVYPEGYADFDQIEWASSAPAVAEVDQTGLVTAKGGGEAVITATAGGKSAQCRVSVFIAPTAIAFSTPDRTIRTGESAQLDLVVTPSGASLDGLEWKSSDATIARVNADGTVTGLKGGKVTITAKVPSLPEATCQLTVLQPVQSVTLDKNSLSMSRGATYHLTATVSPAQYADYDRIEWSSSNVDVAVVDQTGLVTCTGSGTAVISAVAGGKSASCTVTGHVYVESVTLDVTSLNLGIGEIRQLVATILPYDATVQTPTWSSSNTGVATVDKYGNVKGVKVGIATITATADGQKATCEVTVTNKVTSITLNVATLQLRQGETYQFIATVKPTNATHKEVSWSVSNTSVATIDASGLLTTKKEGTVTVTASVQDGLTAICEVTVSNKTEGGGHEGTGEETWY